MVVPHFYKSEMLLKQAKQSSQNNAANSPDNGNKPAFEKKNLLCQLFVCAEAAQGFNIIFFINDEHRK